MMNLAVAKLPDEIQRQILSYSHSPQSPELCEDIRNFHSSLNELYNIYYNIYIVDFHEEYPEDKLWMMNDLLSYMNGYYPPSNGHTKFFYEIIRRSYMNQNTANLFKSVRHIMSPTISIVRQIRIAWGLLTPIEREYYVIHAFKLEEELRGLDLEEEEEEEDWDF